MSTNNEKLGATNNDSIDATDDELLAMVAGNESESPYQKWENLPEPTEDGKAPYDGYAERRDLDYDPTYEQIKARSANPIIEAINRQIARERAESEAVEGPDS